MIALLIIVAVIVLILLLPVGVDASYLDAVAALSVKIGPFRLRLLPREEKPEKPEKPKKPKKAKKKPEKPEGEGTEKKKSPLPKVNLDDVFELLGIVFRLLGRFRRFLSIDRFMLHLAVASEEPYNAVLLYGRINAALGALAPGFHRAFKVKKEDVQLCLDVTPGAKLEVEGRLCFSWQIWELLHTVNCAAASAIRWYLRKRREEKRAAKAAGKNKVSQGSEDHSHLMEQKG